MNEEWKDRKGQNVVLGKKNSSVVFGAKILEVSSSGEYIRIFIEPDKKLWRRAKDFVILDTF